MLNMSKEAFHHSDIYICYDIEEKNKYFVENIP